MILAVGYLLLLVYTLIAKDKSLAVFLMLAAICCDLIQVSLFNISISVFEVTGLLYLPVYIRCNSSSVLFATQRSALALYILATKPYLILILGSLLISAFTSHYFGEHYSDSFLSLSTKYYSKPFISSFSLLAQLSATLFFIKLINNLCILKIVKVIESFTVFYFGFAIFSLINQDILLQQISGVRTDSAIFSRVHGLSGEPRYFGLVMGSLALLLLFIKVFGNLRVSLIVILIGSVGVIISLSASAIIVFTVGILCSLASLCFGRLSRFKNISKKRLYTITATLICTIVVFSLLPQIRINSYDFADVLLRFNQLTNADSSQNIDTNVILELISRFEIFDRLALSVYINYPSIFLHGLGPNIVSIPMNYFASGQDLAFISVFTAAPHLPIVNYLGWLGIYGVYLYFKVIYNFYRFIKSNRLLCSLCILMVVQSLLCFPPLLWFTFMLIAVLSPQAQVPEFCAKIQSDKFAGA